MLVVVNVDLTIVSARQKHPKTQKVNVPTWAVGHQRTRKHFRQAPVPRKGFTLLCTRLNVGLNSSELTLSEFRRKTRKLEHS